MAESIPNLWRKNENPARLYQLYIYRLEMNRRYERVVFACRQIRRYAKACSRAEDALFTFPSEIDSLCDLQCFNVAWGQLRRWDAVIFGNRIDLEHHRFSAKDVYALESWHAPLLYYLQQYRLGCQLLETALDFWFDMNKVPSFEVLFRIYNGENEPTHRCRVTLSHFYNHLGKDLKSWRHWDAFVRGFHSRLFRLAEIRREDLVANPQLLDPFFSRLMDLRDARTTSGVTNGQSDLIDSSAKVKRRQENTKQKLEAFEQNIKPTWERTNQTLLELFPELQNLPR